MKRSLVLLMALAAVMTARPEIAPAQTQWMVGMRLGLSIFTGYGLGNSTANSYLNYFYGNTTTPSSTSAGLQIGPTAEVIFDKHYAVVTAFNINTEAGTPIEWQNSFKYYFTISGSNIKPYADAGFSLIFATGGPYFGIPFGGGALFPLSKNLYIPADLQFGPVFLTGTTAFAIEATTGIRFVF
jgi:hypothetical protein